MKRQDVSLRERTRRAVRAEIVDAALELFVTQGFETTTVEEIARAAGISRRSYFRYFASKDAALTEGLASTGSTIAMALRSRPDIEDDWLALRRAFDPLVQQADADPRSRDLARLLLEHPSLQHQKAATWTSAISEALTLRQGGRDRRDPVETEALVASAIACLHVAQRRWLDPEAMMPLRDLLDAAMRSVRALSETSGDDPRKA